MMLADGYHDVPPGKVASVVTALEMHARPSPRPVPDGSWSVREMPRPDIEWYRDLYRRIGTDWLWFSRLAASDTALATVLHDPAVLVTALAVGGRDEGLLELDFRTEGECELTFFGLTPEIVGGGAGRFLMHHAIELAWARPIRRFWVHTCNLDHPAALPFYIRSGFTPFKLQIEIADDPRLIGLSPRESAPQVPIIKAFP